MTAVMWIFVLFTGALGAARVYFGLYGIETDTGFYIPGLETLANIQNLLYVLGIALLLLLVFRLPKQPAVDILARAKALGLLLTAAGAVAGISSVARVFVGVAAPARGGGPPAMQVLAAAVGVSAAVSFIYMGVHLLRGGAFGVGLWIAVPPALWMAVDVVALFLRYSTIASISGQTLEVTALCFGALFWLGHARMTASIPVGRSPRRAKLWGMLFGLLAVSLCVGELAAAAAGRSSIVDMALSRQIYLLMLGIYAIVWSAGINARTAGGAENRENPA